MVQTVTRSCAKTNTTNRTSKRSFFAPSGSSSAGLAATFSKCAVVAPSPRHSKGTDVHKAVVAAQNGWRSSNTRWTASGLARGKLVAEGMDQGATKTQDIHWRLREKWGMECLLSVLQVEAVGVHHRHVEEVKKYPQPPPPRPSVDGVVGFFLVVLVNPPPPMYLLYPGRAGGQDIS